MRNQFDQFELGYIEAIFKLSSTDDDESFESLYDIEDLSQDAIDLIHRDCTEFKERAKDWIYAENYNSNKFNYDYREVAGVDFWLTRNGHGSGFWDGDWKNPAGIELTELSMKFKSLNAYVGDDGKIYLD